MPIKILLDDFKNLYEDFFIDSRFYYLLKRAIEYQP